MLTPRIVDVEPLNEYKLRLVFETGEIKLFDVKPYLSGEWFGQLLDPDYFATVHIQDGGIEWSNGQDIAPHELYDSGNSMA